MWGLVQLLDWQNKLTNQKPSSFKVLYIGKGKYLAACVVKGREKREFGDQGVSFSINTELICDAGTYWFNTESEKCKDATKFIFFYRNIQKF